VSALQVPDAAGRKYDIVALGEVMLRLDPGEGRIRAARVFNAWEGGGEYNVARGLACVFQQRAAVLTALVDNEVGRLLEGLIRAGGVDVSLVHWLTDDGVGRLARNGLNFTERGFGLRGAVGVSDRGHTAAAQMRPEDIDLEGLFTASGVRWLHTGGIYAALSEQSAATLTAVLQAARKAGTVISYDLNYRPSLWRGIGGQPRAQEVNRALAPLVDVMIGNEEDFTAALGFEVEGVDEGLTRLPVDSYGAMIAQAARDYPNFKVIATTLRTVRSASRNDWGALAWSEETGVIAAPLRERLEILDRVGGGDSFASGLIHGLLRGEPLERALALGAAHGALAMTTPGDTSMASAAEVERAAAGGNARVRR
jgi:2-dehydro-3-deoxygluconokinase